MKKLLILIISMFSFTAFAQRYSDVVNERMTFEKWSEESKSNIRLLPKYGNAIKTEEQKLADKEFIETVLKQDGTNRKGSEHLISLGFSYLYKDTKTAMYRFNQAFLLDSTNTDIYWGFGGIYMVLGNYEMAKVQYLEGLKLDPNNTHLLTDLATYYMIQHANLAAVSKKDSEESLNTAINYFNRSYQFDPKDQNTLFKLSVAYFTKGDCANAQLFYKKCKVLGGRPITKEYEEALKASCKN